MKRTRGFTLIELMIVVGIIGIIVALAGPIFVHYKSRARATETHAMMGSIRTNQEAFRAAYDNYADVTVANPNPGGPSGPPSAFKRLWEDRPCPAACSRLNPLVCTEFSCIGLRTANAVHYSYITNSFVGPNPPSRSEYAMGALGDVDGDLAFSSFSYQTANAGGVVGLNTDTISACPAGIIAGFIVECTPMVF